MLKRYKYRESFRITLKDIYQLYPFKKRPNTTYQALPYVSKKDHTNEQYSLTYSDWILILSQVFKAIFKKLLAGESIILPHNLGELTILKIKSRKKIDWKKTIASGKYHYHDNAFTEHWSPVLNWSRAGIKKFRNNDVWKVRLAKSALKELGKFIGEDPTNINIFNTTNKMFRINKK